MDLLTEQQRRDVIISFWRMHSDKNKAFTATHFSRMGVAASTTYSIINNYQVSGSTAREAGSGGKLRKVSNDQVKRLVNSAVKNGTSTRKLASRYNISQTRAVQLLKENGISHFKKRKAPKMTCDQEIRAKSCCSALRRDFFPPGQTTSIVMDDESYFPYSGKTVTGYYSSVRDDAPLSQKLKFQEKFSKRLLVWLAFSERGFSNVFFAPRNCSVDGEMYRSECVEKRLIPFLQDYHADGNYYFWPDLASAHYARATTALFVERGIRFIPKNCNPPCVPQLRPIENLWSILKTMVYANGWSADTEEQLKRRIKFCLKKLTIDDCQRLFRSTKSRIRLAADNGPFAVI